MSIEKLHNALVEQDLLSIDFDEFQSKLQDNNYKSKVHGAIVDQDLYSGDFDTFNKQFFDSGKVNYNDADFGKKLTDLGARTAYGFVSFAEGLSDYKDGLLYTLSTIGEDGKRSPEAKEAAMIAIKEVYGGDPFEKLMEGLDKKTLEFDEKTITETFKEGDFAEGGFRAVGAGLQSLPSILAAGLGPAGSWF